ncbi:MAG: hypothetical protein K8R58_04620 [Bacteroidales bacterium]|nr:hypothetical protein [Bacteroidales bacterium]
MDNKKQPNKKKSLKNINKKSFHLILFFVIIIFSLILIQCGSTSSDENKLWEKSKSENTVTAYNEYFKQYPNGKYFKEADTLLGELLYSKATKGSINSSFDEYKKLFPNGIYLSKFEKLFYDNTVNNNTKQTFEEYISRFPKGKYLQEIETILYNKILNNQSVITFKEYIAYFPESDNINEIEQILYDSAIRTNTIISFEDYKNSFPEGININKADSCIKAILLNTAVLKNQKYLFNKFISQYPNSEYIKSIKIKTNPSKVTVNILDNSDSLFRTIESPGVIRAIEGTKIKISIEKENYNKDLFEYIITNEPEQTISRNLKLQTKVISFDNFGISKRAWSFNENNNIGIVNNDNLLDCSVINAQFQKLRKFNMDLNKDFEIEMKFKIVNSEEMDVRSYFGIIWGEKLKVKYFFLTKNGHYNYGKQNNNEPNNRFNYTRWGESSLENDSWSISNNFFKNDFNVLRVIKKGSKIKYFINNKYIHFENEISRFKSSWVGFGIGNANVLVDYIRIEQYY